MNTNIRQSLTFVLLVLGLSYLVFWGPIAILKLQTANLVVGEVYNIPALILFILGGFVPSLVGVWLTYVFEGKAGVKSLFKSAVNLKIGLHSVLTIFGYALVLCSLQIVLYSVLGGKPDYYQFIKQLPSTIPLLVLGPLSEEFGWRGFLQKRINFEFSPISGTIIIGLVWSMWHLPLFYMIGTSQHDFNLPFVNFAVSVVSSSFIYTYLYIRTKGILFSAILLHWVTTYFLQVIVSQVDRTLMYNMFEFVPSLVLAFVFIFLFLKNQSKERFIQ